MNAFECQMCGHCCQGEGGIVLTPKDRARLAEFLGMDEAEMVDKYCETRVGKLQVRVGEDGYCVFFRQGEGCSAHPGRPDICRAWPFFRGNLIDEISWELSLDYCPGISKDAGFERFKIQGLEYLRKNGLLEYDGDDAPNALKL